MGSQRICMNSSPNYFGSVPFGKMKDYRLPWLYSMWLKPAGVNGQRSRAETMYGTCRRDSFPERSEKFKGTLSTVVVEHSAPLLSVTKEIHQDLTS